ncbi:hypothetical protein PR202_ga29976 [Eleusine coracana subsp. coracana]|uniref:Uncharacterized protein n=1 Tax=Eleusine coracana subsp. coracana TaxID=191504 RepID=A0AAV5DL32_ELECO|nr:hypothetical protein PR202_ga29976 [Eleusine coracana subsp. coracana]
MKKIDEEIKKGLNIIRTVGAPNQASALQRAEQNVPKNGNRGPKIGNRGAKIGNSGHPRIISTSEHLAPLAKNAGKSNHSPSILHHLNQDLTSRINIHSKYSGIVKDKDATLSSIELSREAKMKQGPVHSSNFIKGSLQANRLKAMPGLVHNTKNQLNIDHGATKGINSESEPNVIGGMKNKNTRCEPGLKTSSDTNLNIPKKRRKYIDTNDDDIDEDDPTRLPSHHATLKDCNAIVSLPFHSNSESAPNLDKGVTKGINVESGPNAVGGMKDKNMRCEPLLGPKTSSGSNLNMPKKSRKYIVANGDVDDFDDHRRDEDDPIRLPLHHATLKDGNGNVNVSPPFLSYNESGPNVDQGVSKGINSESCPNVVGGMKDKNTRGEPLPGPKTSSYTNLNKPKKRRKYIDTNDDVDDIDDNQRDEDDCTRLPSHHSTLKA